MPPAQVPVIALDHTRDHHAQAALLRQAGPVVQVMLPGGVLAWTVTRHRLLEEIARHPHITRDYETWTARRDGRIPEDWPLAGMFFVRNMFTAGGDDHRRLRGVVAEAFRRRQVEDLRPDITAIIGEVLDALPSHAAPDGTVDLRQHYAYPVPMRVICRLLGVPSAWQEDFRHLVDALFRTDTSPQEAAAVEQQRITMLRNLIELHWTQPGDDLTSALVQLRRENPDALSDDELLDTLWLLVTAGHETTLAAITNAIRALATHPDQRALALTGTEDVWDRITTESLRRDGPIGNLIAGYTTAPITLADVTIPAGEAILGPYAGVGRDPDQHGPDADLFDITRAQRRHLAFGIGVHHCLGAPLAGLTIPLALQHLFTRYPDLALAVPDTELQPLPSLFTNTTTDLPIRLGKAATPPLGFSRNEEASP